VFQSHTYSRTKTLLNGFATCFTDASLIVVNEIFSSAREKDNLGMTGRKLSEAIKVKNPRVEFCPDKDSTLAYLKKETRKGDVVFTLGAGNNWLWHKDILKSLKK
jgi:UDP-N-acetylmuramate--alanine ligase